MAVTDYLRGTGTSSDPYIIHNVAAWVQYFVDKKKGLYFEVVADINCGGITISGDEDGFTGNLNGNGHRVYNFSTALYYLFAGQNTAGVALKNIHIGVTYTGPYSALSVDSTSVRVNWVNVRFDISLTNSLAEVFERFNSSTPSVLDNVIITYNGKRPLCSYASTNNLATKTYVIAPNSTSLNASGTGVVFLTSAQSLLPDQYPTLGSTWIMDGISIPYLYPNGRQDLTIKYAVSGHTLVGGNQYSRDIIIFIAATMSIIKKLKSGADGSYFIDFGDIYDPVLIVHYEDYGFPLVQNKSYVLGDIIHPNTPNGYRYICTVAGLSNSIALDEPWSTINPITSGAATFTPNPVYAAETLLVQPHLYDFLNKVAA